MAALVAGHQADAGFGLEAAASRFGLEFVPVATERYYLAVDAESLASPGVQAVLRRPSRPASARPSRRCPDTGRCRRPGS